MTRTVELPKSGCAGSSRFGGRGISPAKPAELRVRFSEAKPRGVEGLVKLFDCNQREAHDWSPTSSGHVVVASEDQDEDFDIKDALRPIDSDRKGLSNETSAWATRNFEELGG